VKILNFINNLLKSKTPGHAELVTINSDDFYFHEDEYCQIEYLPKENMTSVSKMAIDISKHSEEHFDGKGWTGVFVRSGFPTPTKSKNYSAHEFADFLKSHGFDEYPRVTTGYGQTVILCHNTRAFKNLSIDICFDYENDIVKNIWETTGPYKTDQDVYKKFLLAVAEKYNFLVADWWKTVVVDISVPKNIDKYFAYDE